MSHEWNLLSLPHKRKTYEGLDDPGGDIVLMLGKAVAELRVVIFLTNTREYVYAFDLTDELEEGEPTRYLVEFF